MTLLAILGLALAVAPQGDADMTARLLKAVDTVRIRGGGAVSLAPGTYHFRSPTPMSFYVSNHDDPLPRNVFLPITNVTDLALVCDGRAEFVFHGEGIGLGLLDTRNVKLRGIGVDWDRPYFNEVTVDEVLADGRIVISADPKQFPLALDGGGRLVSVGEGWETSPRLFEVFDGVKLSRTGVTWIDGAAEALGGNRFRLRQDFSKVKFVSPLKKGDFAVLRVGWRPNPAVCLYRADDTVLEDCVVHSSPGMGLIAQRCANVTLRGTGRPLDRRAGSFARAGTGRRLSLQADATHFSNCRGKVAVTGCLFEGMVDDAINVHSTCLQIERILSPTSIRCRYRNKQSVGFEVFRPGERLRCIRSRTLEPTDGVCAVVGVEQSAPDTVDLALEERLPAGIAVGDAVENADWQPAVEFRGNVVRNSSPRATLFTTPGKIVCEDNAFEHIAGQAVHLSADVRDWYETGACRDVTIRNNVFRDVCILSGKGAIQIDPNVPDLAAQKARYHRNVRIENNVFEQDRGPLLYARSASNIVWRANRVLGRAKDFDVRYCDFDCVRTFCNPLPMPDLPKSVYIDCGGKGIPHRQVSDPNLLRENGRWYLYPSSGFVYESRDDGGTWICHTNAAGLVGYGPGAVRHRGKYYYMPRTDGEVYVGDRPDGEFRSLGKIVLPKEAPYPADAMLFSDTDGRLYFYWGCTAQGGIWGCELDAENPVRLVSRPVELIPFDPAGQPWERCAGKPEYGWLEGAWMVKLNGRYCLTFAAGGTQNPTYAMGAYWSDKPLAGFRPQKRNPFFLSPTGLVTGTGHGSVVQDERGDLWVSYCVTVGDLHWFERRVGLDRLELTADGEIKPASATSEPQLLPAYGRGAAGWRKIPVRTLCSAAADDSLQTVTWVPTPPGSIAYEFVRPATVRAFRICWRENGYDPEKGVKAGPIRYRLSVRLPDGSWKVLRDASGSNEDLLVDYRETEATPATAARLEVLDGPPGIKIAVSDWTLFGD